MNKVDILQFLPSKGTSDSLRVYTAQLPSTAEAQTKKAECGALSLRNIQLSNKQEEKDLQVLTFCLPSPS